MKKTIAIILVVALAGSLLLLSGCAAKPADIKTGVGVVTSIAKSKNAAPATPEVPAVPATATTAEVPAVPAKEATGGIAQVDTIIAAVTIDAEGKILKVSFDSAQTKVNFDVAGNVTSDKAAEVKTKKELGDEYGMKKASAIGKEWFEQIAAFEEWCVGKTIEEVNALTVKVKDDAHPAVPDVPELTSSVTISVQDYQAALTKAVANAK